MPAIITAEITIVSSTLSQNRPGRRRAVLPSLARADAVRSRGQSGPAGRFTPAKHKRDREHESETNDLDRYKRPEQSVVETWRAADGRSVGPVHGRKFTPAAIDADAGQDPLVHPQPLVERQHRRNGHEKRHGAGAVEVHQQCQERGTDDDAGGMVPTARRMRSTIGSSMPASVMMPK